MRLNRPPGVASNPEPAGGRRAGAGVVRVLSVTAAAVAVCAMGALPAMASSAHTTKHSSKTRVSIPKTAYTHTDVKLSATVTGGKTPTGTVTFWLGTKKLCHGTLSKGKTSCEYKFADPAKKTITGKYSGNSTHKTSSGTATITVTNKPTTTPPPPTEYATTTTITYPALDEPVTEQAGTVVTLTATVASVGGGAVPTGTVSFAPWNFPGPYPSYEVCTATLVDGTGSCTVDPPIGTWGFSQFEATYSGDATHTGSNSGDGDNKLITPDNTTTTVGPATAAAGSVTLNATIVPYTDGAPPFNILAGESETGGDLVSFTIGGATVTGCGAVPMTWNGTVNVAACPTTLAAGTYTIQAAYSGDEYTNPSTSLAVTLTVS
jgi:large repetitive protein